MVNSSTHGGRSDDTAPNGQPEAAQAGRSTQGGASRSTARAYKVLTRHTYRSGGGERVGWSYVGVASTTKNGDGFNVLIHPGIAVSGQLYIRPFDESEDAPTFDYKPFVGEIR